MSETVHTGAEESQYSSKNFQECVCFELRRTSRLVTQLYDAQFQQTGLRSTQFPILAALLHGEASLKELARALTLEHSTLVRSVRPLLEAGFVTMEPGKDRRVKIVALTEAGREKIDEIEPLWLESQSTVVDALGAEEWELLRGHLKSIRKIIHKAKHS